MNISLRQAAELMFESKTVAITGHVHPDGDCLGSMLALYCLLKTKHINIRLLLDDDIPTCFKFLPNINIIERPTMRIKADLLIVVDASDISRIGNVKNCVNAPILNIDHHRSNTGFAEYTYVDQQAAATGVILCEMFAQAMIKPEAAAATCLYTAIATDCGFFRYANTTSSVLRHAANLIDCGVQPVTIAEALDTRSANNLLILMRVLETLELVLDGRVACITIDADIIDSDENTSDFINYPRSIDGVEVAVMFKQHREGLIRVSMRSRNLDVSAIAMSFGGGGHQRAAGCSLDGTLDEAKQLILNKILQALRIS